MKYFVPFNKNGKVEMTEAQLKYMLSDAYREGYSQGQIDRALNEAPTFEISEDRENQKKHVFSDGVKTIIFRATIL